MNVLTQPRFSDGGRRINSTTVTQHTNKENCTEHVVHLSNVTTANFLLQKKTTARSNYTS